MAFQPIPPEVYRKEYDSTRCLDIPRTTHISANRGMPSIGGALSRDWSDNVLRRKDDASDHEIRELFERLRDKWIDIANKCELVDSELSPGSGGL